MIFQTHDLLYNVMLHADFNFSFVNKLSYSIYNNEYFCNQKNLTCTEYKIMYKAYQKAVDMTEVMLLVKNASKENFDMIYISIGHHLFEPKDLYWLTGPICKQEFCLVFIIDHFTFQNHFTFQMHSGPIRNVLSKEEFIDFFTKLFYHFPSVTVEDVDDTSFFQKPGYMDIDDSKLEIHQMYMKYWGLYKRKY